MDVRALEERAAIARNAWACTFASSDEYEQALISERRAEGRYGTQTDWILVAGIACGLAIVCLTTLLTLG